MISLARCGIIGATSRVKMPSTSRSSDWPAWSCASTVRCAVRDGVQQLVQTRHGDVERKLVQRRGHARDAAVRQAQQVCRRLCRRRRLAAMLHNGHRDAD